MDSFGPFSNAGVRRRPRPESTPWVVDGNTDAKRLAAIREPSNGHVRVLHTSVPTPTHVFELFL